MAFKQFPFLALSFSLFFSLFVSLSIAASHNHKNYKSSPEAICDSDTINPSYCKRVLANERGNDVYDYCRISFRKSLSQSRKFANLVDSYIQSSSSWSQPTVRALQDCQFLSQLNLEYFLNTYPAVNQTSGSLPLSEAEDAQTLLSAILTNQQTCLEGLQTTASDSRVKNDLSTPLINDTDLHTVTLDLFVRAWIPDNTTKSSSSSNNHGKHKGFSNGRLPMKMSRGARGIYNAAKGHGRKLLQTVNDNDSVVIKDIVVVSKDGSGNFTTINDAIAAAPNNTAAIDGYFLIYVTEGVYQEYISIIKQKKYLMLLGDGINRTIITGNRSVVDGWTTFNSATFAVVAQGFVAVNITFRNTAGPSKHQAVAVRSGADLSTFYSCSFEGYQDTLYTHSLRQVYRECDIYGTVDFIFGNAAVVLQNCNIYPRLPMSGQFNAITAQGRVDPNQNTGISIQNATIKAAGDLFPVVGTVKTYLGRPWKQYSRTVYMQSFMDGLIDASGWKDWNGTFALDTLYYAEYENRGAGSSTRNRVPWPGYHVIKAKEAAQFTVSNFVQGDVWLPQTGVPFLTGLN